MATDCDPDGSRETRPTPPKRAAFHLCRAAPACVLRDVLRAHTASAELTRPSVISLAHPRNGLTASDTHRSRIGWLVLSFCQSTKFLASHGDLTTEGARKAEIQSTTKVAKENTDRWLSHARSQNHHCSKLYAAGVRVLPDGL